MKTVKVSDKDAVNQALKFIEQGKVLICPTDTVYGLLADATNDEAVKKVFEIKKRPLDKALPVFVSDVKMAKKIAFINRRKEQFLKKIWPGKVTAVLKGKSNSGLSRMLFGDQNTVGLRVPNYKIVNDILKKAKKPLTGTSANISGLPSSTKISEIKKQFKENNSKPDLIISSGSLDKALPSTVINLTKKRIKILRKGDYLKTLKYKFYAQ